MDPIALVCSVEQESEPVRRRLTEVEPLTFGLRRGWRGRLRGCPVVLLEGGMGKTNAAHALTLLLERTKVRGIAGFGIAGAYPASGLGIGDVALAHSQHYGDEGVDTASGWISCEGIGIPLVERSGLRLFNDFPLHGPRLEKIVQAFADEHESISVGPFVTVSCCSGRAERGMELAHRYGAICETMEGAAYAHVASIYGEAYIEVRGISNLVEDRDVSRWRVADAAIAAASALDTVLAAW